MASIGPLSPTTAVSGDDGITSFAGDIGNVAGSGVWSNPGNVVSQDDSAATFDGADFKSEVLLASGFDLSSIDSNATLDGLQLELELYSTTGALVGGQAQFALLNSFYVGSTKDLPTSLPTSDNDTYQSLGGPSDTWGLGMAQVLDADFAVGFYVTLGFGAGGETVGADHVRLTVHYTPPFNGVPVLQDAKVRVVGLEDAQVY